MTDLARDARERLERRHGAAVVGPWWAALEVRLAELAAAWELEIGEPVGSGNTSLVLHATRADGSPAILKLVPDEAIAAQEAAALRAWRPPHVPAVLAADGDALLLERIEGTRPDRPRDPQALATLLLALHAPPPPPGTPSLATRATHAFDLRIAQHPERADALRRGRVIARELAASGHATLLHGDLHPANVIQRADGTLTAFDPRPCVGDPAFDAEAWRDADAPLPGVDRVRLERWREAFAAW